MTRQNQARTAAPIRSLTPIATTPINANVRRTGALAFVDAQGRVARLRHRMTPCGGDSIVAITCDANTAAAVEAAWNDLGRSGDYDDNPASYEQASADALMRAAPALVQALKHGYATNPCIVHVAGLPGSTPTSRTPLDGIVNQALVSNELRALIGAAAAMGVAGFGYTSENGGRLVRAVCPLPSEANKISSQGAVDLGYHADNADLAVPNSADRHPTSSKPMNQWQGFATIRPKRGVPMRVIAVADVVAYMRTRGWRDHVETLMQPVFAVSAPASHGEAKGVIGVPVLVNANSGHVATRYHAVNVTASDPTAQLALEAFGAAARACRGELALPGRPGELLFYQNPRSLHRRQPFEPAFDGADRFYLRIYFDTFESLSSFSPGLPTRIFG